MLQVRCTTCHNRTWLTTLPLAAPLQTHRAPERGTVQTLALAYWSFHYIKRLLETAFVHK